MLLAKVVIWFNWQIDPFKEMPLIKNENVKSGSTPNKLSQKN
jgi:hypothetical protein